MEKVKGKFTEVGNMSQKYRKRGETSLAKFVSSNGKVTGTLMLDQWMVIIPKFPLSLFV